MLALGVIVALGFAVEAAAGFGSTLLILGVGGLLFPLPYLLNVVVPVNLVLSAWLLSRDRQACDVRLVFLQVLPLMAVGLALGLAIGALVPTAGLSALYALFVIALSLVELRRGSQPRAAEPKMGAWLFSAGVAHGLFAASGPLVVVALASRAGNKREFRATLAALWLVLNGVFVATQALRGSLGVATLRTSVLLVPPLLVGIAVGSVLHALLDAARFRTMVFGTLLASGCVLLVSAA